MGLGIRWARNERFFVQMTFHCNGVYEGRTDRLRLNVAGVPPRSPVVRVHPSAEGARRDDDI